MKIIEESEDIKKIENDELVVDIDMEEKVLIDSLNLTPENRKEQEFLEQEWNLQQREEILLNYYTSKRQEIDDNEHDDFLVSIGELDPRPNYWKKTNSQEFNKDFLHHNDEKVVKHKTNPLFNGKFTNNQIKTTCVVLGTVVLMAAAIYFGSKEE